MTVFATFCALLAPCAALASPDEDTFDFRKGCEMSLNYPLSALISPIIHEIPTLNPAVEININDEKKGWIKQKNGIRPPVRKRPPRPPNDPKKELL